MFISHATADRIIREEWPNVHGRPATNNEVLFTQAVAWLETHYGQIGQHATLREQGKINWANIEKIKTTDECPDGWAEGQDEHPVCFRVFDTDNEAARALIQNLTKRHWPVIDAIANIATPEAVADAMATSPSYYGNNPPAGSSARKNYAQAIKNSIQAFGKTIEAPAVAVATKSGSGILPAIGIGLGGLLLGYNYFRKRR